jgi:nicotinamidase-related amidase
MEKSDVLVIIDLQKSFYDLEGAVFNEIRQPVIREINNAIENNSYIFLVTYRCSGRTSRFATNAMKRYNKKHYVTKENDDGSNEINRKINKLNINVDNIIVCGVNTSYCVFDTVYGLNHLNQYMIHVVADACMNCCDDGNHDYSLKKMSKMSNVFVRNLQKMVA